MPHSSDTKKPSVTLEQLLQVKRSERPAPEFWEEFNQELRRRQLATVVSVRPWYARLGQACVTTFRRTAPIGAAATALVAGFLALERRDQPSAPVVQSTQNDTETASTIALPEEHIVLMSEATPHEAPVVATAPLAHAQPSYAMQELVSATAPARSFVTIATPRTFSAVGGRSDIYVVNTLTTEAAFHAPGQPIGGSF